MANALDRQVAGNHYKILKIQPMEYSLRGALDAAEHSVVKYLTRNKGCRMENIQKAYHCIELRQEFTLQVDSVWDEEQLDREFYAQFKNGRVYKTIIRCMIEGKYGKAKENLTKFIRYGRWEEI